MAVYVQEIPQHLDDRPEMKYLNRYVKEPLCAKSTEMWKDLGTELLGSNNTLDVINNNNCDIRNCCSAMFQLWLDRQPTASWRKLIEALKQLQLNHLADQIESKFTISVLEPSTVIPGQVLPELQRHPLLANDQLRAEFGRLIMTIRRILSNSPNREDNLDACKELCIYLKASGNANIPLFSPVEINNCRDFKQLFEIVNHHLSWDEHSLLNEIIDECGSDEAEQEFTKYKRKMAISKALEIISSTPSNPPPGFEKFCVIIDKSYKKLTVEKYEEIKTFIFNSLDVHRYVTTGYIRVLFGSLHLEWHVTLQAVPHMIRKAHEQQTLFKRNFFVFIQIGREVIINTQTEQFTGYCHTKEIDANTEACTSPLSEDQNVSKEGVGLSLCEDPNNSLGAASEESQRRFNTQIPTTSVLDPDKQEIGKTRAYKSEDAKQTRWVDSLDIAAKPDKIDVRREIMTELVETEEEYVKKLGHVCENYISEIEMNEGLPERLVGKKDVIFSNIEMLYAFNKDVFLPELQRIKQTPMKLGQIFIDHETHLISYSWYFKNMPAQKKLMKEVGAEYFTQVQNRLSDPFPLMENLLLPFQRINHYSLFLKRMINDCVSTVIGYDELKEAHKIINFVLHHDENLLAVENLIGFSGNLVEQGLIQHQGDLTIIKGRFTSSRRRVFLFEKIIIIAKKDKGSTDIYTYKKSYQIYEVHLIESICHPTRFELWDGKKHTHIVFQTDDIKKKTEWIDAIHDVFTIIKKKIEAMNPIKDNESEGVRIHPAVLAQNEQRDIATILKNPQPHIAVIAHTSGDQMHKMCPQGPLSSYPSSPKSIGYWSGKSSFSSNHSSVPSKKSSAGYQSGVCSPFASPRSDRHQSSDPNISRHKQLPGRSLEDQGTKKPYSIPK